MRIENKEEFEFGEVFSVAREGAEVEFEIGFWNKGEKGKGKARREETEEMGATRRRSRREQWKDMLLFS